MSTTLLPFQPATMSSAQLAAVSFLARYSGRTRALYAYQLQCRFGWCQSNNGLDPLVGVQRAHVELYIRGLGESGLMDSSVVTMMHGVRGFFRFAHIDGLISADPAVYARLPKVQRDESRTQGLDRLELIRFLQVAQTITVHHGALAYLLGINALRASEAAAVRVEDYSDTLRGYRVLHLVGKGNKPATMPLTIPVLRVLEVCRGERTSGPLVLRPVSGKPIDRRDVYRMVARIAKAAQIPRHIQSAFAAARCDHQRPGRRCPAARRADPRPARRPRTTEHYDRARGNRKAGDVGRGSEWTTTTGDVWAGDSTGTLHPRMPMSVSRPAGARDPIGHGAREVHERIQWEVRGSSWPTMKCSTN